MNEKKNLKKLKIAALFFSLASAIFANHVSNKEQKLEIKEAVNEYMEKQQEVIE